MRKPRVFFRLMRRAWRRWLMPPSETRAISSIDAREFSDLLVSGRTKDLKILAGKAQPARSRFTGQGPGQTVAPAWQQFKRVRHCKVDGAVGVSRNVGWLSARATTGAETAQAILT